MGVCMSLCDNFCNACFNVPSFSQIVTVTDECNCRQKNILKRSNMTIQTNIRLILKSSLFPDALSASNSAPILHQRLFEIWSVMFYTNYSNVCPISEFFS